MLAFRSMMAHTCTIQRIQIVERSGASYGHTVRNERVIVAQYPLTICRFRPMSSDERQEVWNAQQIRAQYVLYMVYIHLPPGLNQWSGWSEFQITSIVNRRTGVILEHGPLDITNVDNEAGATHHARMMLLRGA